MGRTKKTSPVLAPKEVQANSIGDNPPAPKKRGRPRKVKAEDQSSSDGKKQKASEDDGSKNSIQKTQTELLKAGSTDVTVDKEEVPKPVVKKEGSRRKSEPRRAAESFGALFPTRWRGMILCSNVQLRRLVFLQMHSRKDL